MKEYSEATLPTTKIRQRCIILYEHRWPNIALECAEAAVACTGCLARCLCVLAMAQDNEDIIVFVLLA